MKVCYKPAKIDGHRHIGSRDMMVFVCDVSCKTP